MVYKQVSCNSAANTRRRALNLDVDRWILRLLSKTNAIGLRKESLNERPGTSRVIVERTTFHGIEESDMSEMAAIREVFPANDPKVVTNPISGKIPTLHRMENMGVSEAAIRQQLARMLQSPIFVQSGRLSRFLRFIVEHVISGNQNHLKEYVIGSEVYDRRPPYNPSQDSIVRTEARRLRGKLKEYYESDGKDDPVYIYLRPGSYVPVLQSKEALGGRPKSLADTHDPILSWKKSPITIAILPFHDITGSPLSSIYTRGIPDELAYTLMRTEGCRVISPASMAHFSAQEHDVTAAIGR